MTILKSTTETIEIATTSTADIDYSVSYTDISSTTFTPSTSEGKITSVTSTTLVSAPVASTQRQIKLITVTNIHATTPNTVVIKKDISGVEYYLTPSVVLMSGESLQFIDKKGWVYYTSTGAIKPIQTAAGSNGMVQVSNNGLLTGDSEATWDSVNNELVFSGTDSNILLKGITNEPLPPNTGTAQVYSKAIVGKMQLKIKGPSGLDTPLQAVLWQNNTVWWQPGATAGVFTGTVGTGLGTNNIPVQATTNLYTAMRRNTYASVVTTLNQQVGIRTENMFYRGASAGQGGFLFVCRFGFTNYTATDRMFVGLCADTTAVVTVDPSTLLNTAGFCLDSADTAITFLHNDGAATGTKDTISGQPALVFNNAYDAYIWCPPNSSTIYYRLDNALTGATLIDSSTSTDLPVNTTMLCAQAVMGNGPTNTLVGAATIGINRMYIETDR